MNSEKRSKLKGGKERQGKKAKVQESKKGV